MLQGWSRTTALDMPEYAVPKCAAYIAEGFPSGQRDQTVNLTAPPSEVRILPPPPGRGPGGKRGCGSMVEPQPSKLMMWVRFPSPAPSVGQGVGQVSRPGESEMVDFRAPFQAHIAQSVEHFLGKEEVIGSNPIMGSSFR